MNEKCLKKLIGSCLLVTRQYNFQPCTPTLSATMHSVTDGQTRTDRRTKDIMMTIAGHTAWKYDRLKVNYRL